MKKFIFIILSIFIFNTWFANSEDYKQILTPIPEEFQNECYEYQYKINKEDILNENIENNINNYKLKIDRYKDLVITQSWSILPYKILWEKLESITYKGWYWLEIVESNDDNPNTYIELDTLESKEMILEMSKTIKKWSSIFNLDYDSKNYELALEISQDWKDFSRVEQENIKDFEFNFLKLTAQCKKLWCVREKIKIYELNLLENKRTIVIKSFFNEDIIMFSDYSCNTKSYNDSFKPYNNFSIDNNTKELNIAFEKNNDFNAQKEIDTDKDWFIDTKDNCPLVYNPEQTDSNANWIWDLCSDDDKDWVIWEKDNCPLIYNPDQIDTDNNWIGDLCEKDSDWDKIYDKIDNCPLVSNSEQIDRDNDWIGDLCDNCKDKYNKEQKDIDNDWIWDLCDENDDRVIENNKTIFLVLFWLIVVIFWVAIYFTTKKINNI